MAIDPLLLGALTGGNTSGQGYTAAEYMYAYYEKTGRWPASRSQVENAVRQRTPLNNAVRQFTGGSQRIPNWAIDMLAPEIGPYVSYLTIRELAPILIQAAAEGWNEGKIAGALSATDWWKQTTAQQRQWNLLSPAEQEQAVARSAIWVMDQLESIYGSEYVRSKGWSVEANKITKWATSIANGKLHQDIFFDSLRRNAQGIEGTHAYNARLEDIRNLNEPDRVIENTEEELRQVWREWMGDMVQPPPDIRNWATAMYLGRRTNLDFMNYVRATAHDLYPNKGEFVAYADWVAPAKEVLRSRLELGKIDDREPLLAAYVQGDIPSLAELDLRAKQDERYHTTTGAVQQARETGFSILRELGFTT